MVYVIFVDGDLDQICETKADALREKRDLIQMDCGRVTVKEFPNETAVHAWIEKRD